MQIPDNGRILFIGDSITDALRDKENPDSMGVGYVHQIAGGLGYYHAEKNLKIINRGISGNRVVDLQRRWKEDCLDVKPDVLTILVGVNDMWRRYDRNMETDVETFSSQYRDIVTQAKDTLGCPIVLMEPFLLPLNDEQRSWREDLGPKVFAVRDIAREFSATLVPLDGLFNQAAIRTPDPRVLSVDGIHAGEAGQRLIADAWMRAVGLLH